MARILLSGALILLLFPAFVQSESHWESYTDWVQGYTWTCVPYFYTVCTNWYYYGYYIGYSGCGCSHSNQYVYQCYPTVGYNCYTNCLGWVLVTKWRCQYGWQGANCDIPICNNPSCTVNQICVRPNTCDCSRSSTGACINEPCDNGDTNCYPGFCDKSGNPWRCLCPPGFTGPNCQTITNTPDISACSVQVFGTPNGQPEQEVARANECAAYGLDPLRVWIGADAANSLTKIVATWQASYNYDPLPGRDKAPYILAAPVVIGIVETNFTVSFPNATGPLSRSSYCMGPNPQFDNPQKIKLCTGINMAWNDLGVGSLARTNFTFIVNIEAQAGGQKTGDNNWVGGRFNTPQIFSMDPSMNTTIRTVKFAFDLEYPYHCLSFSNNCPIFPIFLNQSITPNPVIQPTFNDWHDDGSGIGRFYVDVFYMQPGADGQLVQTGNSIVYGDANITLNNFRFTVPTPGVYSIVLTVYDKAGNTARARKIFVYDDHSSSIAETNSPIYLDKADPNTNYQFITSLEKLQGSSSLQKFSLVWTGRFVSSFPKQWLSRVQAWQNDASGRTIDDNRGTKYGLRSIDALNTTSGVVGYEVSYLVDTNGTGGYGMVAPLDSFSPIASSIADRFNNITVSNSLKDGDTIITWLRVYDLYGNTITKTIKTYIDTSKFNIKPTSTPEFRKHYPDEFNSSVIIPVINRISGIKNITYQIVYIVDNSQELPVKTGTVVPEILSPPETLTKRRKKRQYTVTLPCRSNDTTCYCIPQGNCYNVTQMINIDNCWIDSLAGKKLKIKYTIYSLSGWGLDASIDIGALNPEDILCRNPGFFSRLSVGAIVGISIAAIIFFILLLLLIILLCVMLWRKTHHKHPIPARIRATIHNTFGRNSAAAMNIMSDNEIYSAKGDSLPKKKFNDSPRAWANQPWATEMTRSNVVNCHISGKDLQIGDVISEGRFAVVRKGFYSSGNERTPVAIKSLRSGYDKTDPEVMNSKISFMANEVKPHPNVIRFIGAVAEDKEHGAPVMVLELCDKSLKDWLSEINKVDTEVLESMLSFTLQIARGVQHLHDQKIIHRRLAVRNILLKRTISGYEVKLIGFGPSREDSDERGGDQSTLGVALVPLKWLAPETLETLKSSKPVYDEKTDAWSYGVTIWEIYSKGEAPYANHSSANMLSVLKRGERLTCPEDCPPDMFNQVLHPCWNGNAKKRPNFTKICNSIELFRNGAGMGMNNGGYYAPPGQTGHGPAPPGYYSAGVAIQGGARDNSNADSLYHDARSG